MTPKWLASLQASVWLALIAVFVALAMLPLWRGVCAGYFMDASPFSSTDAYLRSVQPNSALSERVADVLAAAPADRPVVVFYQDDDPQAGFVAMVVGYLAWPHDVHLFEITPANARAQLAAAKIETAGAIVTFRVPPPPSLPPGITLADDMHIVIAPR
jgi:hypothetical protein